ncbi:hypothetical protein F4778DRAFT_721181 [Xylariomycetidae sp. FL2044]|nr:hypothetical protein F4778DRAFT_721181 [Xylariomycetidae sp. FL2044]
MRQCILLSLLLHRFLLPLLAPFVSFIMNVGDLLVIPEHELVFLHPDDAPHDRIDTRFARLRVERRGLRRWDSFEECSEYVGSLLGGLTKCPTGWRPLIVPWARYAGSETNVADLLKSTLILRLSLALDAISSGTMSIVSTPKHFPSYGTDDNRTDGDFETLIGPDLVVLDGNLNALPELKDLQRQLLAFAEIKVKNPCVTAKESRILPGTIACYESWLAQAVQSCLDLDISLGWVQTNTEVVLFHVCKANKPVESRAPVTRSSSRPHAPECLPSDATEETEWSSPIIRQADDWLNFDDGDVEIPLISTRFGGQLPAAADQGSISSLSTPVKQLPQTPENVPVSRSSVKRVRHTTPEPASSSQLSTYPPTPCPDPAATPVGRRGGSLLSSPWGEDQRDGDASHVLITSYSLEDADVGKRLFELILLARRAKSHNVL